MTNWKRSLIHSMCVPEPKDKNVVSPLTISKIADSCVSFSQQ